MRLPSDLAVARGPTIGGLVHDAENLESPQEMSRGRATLFRGPFALDLRVSRSAHTGSYGLRRVVAEGGDPGNSMSRRSSPRREGSSRLFLLIPPREGAAYARRHGGELASHSLWSAKGRVRQGAWHGLGGKIRKT